MAITKHKILARHTKGIQKVSNQGLVLCRHIHEANGRVVSIAAQVEPPDAVHSIKQVERIKYAATIYRPSSTFPMWTQTLCRGHLQTALKRLSSKPVELIPPAGFKPANADTIVETVRQAMHTYGVQNDE